MLVLMGDKAKNGSRRASLELFRLQIVRVVIVNVRFIGVAYRKARAILL
jgi:hypothetical protein